MKCKIAVAQLKITQCAPEKNLRKIERYTAKAAKAGADIVVFPEDVVAGAIEECLQFVDYKHQYRTWFQVLAKRYGIDIVAGSIIEGDKGGMYNTTYYIDATGTVLARYRKVHLWLSERGIYTPGDKITVVKTRFGKIGLCICWDLAFPELFRAMVHKGVEIVVCASYWCYGDAGRGMEYDIHSERAFIDALCIERAFENEIILVYCNAAGSVRFGLKRDALVGHSQITEPFVGVMKKLAQNKEAMLVHEIDTAILKTAERSYKIRNDLKKKMAM